MAAARWRLPICQASSARWTALLGTDVVERFLGRDDLDVTAILQHQPVAIVQGHRFGQVDQHSIATGRFDGAAAQMPLVMGQHRMVVGRDRSCLAGGRAPRRHAGIW